MCLGEYRIRIDVFSPLVMVASDDFVLLVQMVLEVTVSTGFTS